MATKASSGQRGQAAVEFALLCMLFLPFMFALLEYGRLMFLWNVLPEVTRRAARAAAMADFSNPAALQVLRQAALFRAAGSLPMAPNVGRDNLLVEYLWQNTAGDLNPVPVLPACPLANRINCLRDPRGSSCISFVRVRLCGPGDNCPRLEYQALMPMVPVPGYLPPAVTTVAAEALGYTPGQATCP